MSDCLLLMGDDQEIAAARRQLESSCPRIYSTNNLDAAIRLVRYRPVGIILMGLDMTVEAVRILRGATDAIIIALSPDDDELRGIEAIRAGADDFLAKGDVTPSALDAVITSSLTRHNLRATAARMRSKFEQLLRIGGG